MDDWTPLLDTGRDSDSPIVETYDPTWKHNFKWAWNADTGETKVWPVFGSIDGRPYHVTEFRNTWGREIKRSHDILGLATYMPSERKLDGTVVAPAEVLLQAYYLRDIPQGVFDFFEDHFPNTVIRRAKIAAGGGFAEWSPQLQPDQASAVVRWVWNRQDGTLIWQSDAKGLPTHAQRVEQQWGRPENASDYLGYADPRGAKLEIDSYGPTPPPVAIQTVKQKLAELFPDKEIVAPEFEADSFQTDPGTYARREASVKWAVATFDELAEMPLEAPESLSQPTQRQGVTLQPPLLVRGLRKIMGLSTVTADANKDGAMVAVFIPKEVGERIKVKGGEPVEDLHITLAYFAEKANERDDWDEVQRIVEQIAKQHPPLAGKIGGIGIFHNDEDVLWASPSIPGLAELRDDIVEAVEDAGFTLSKEHGWTPHITLKYGFSGKLPKIPNIELKLDELSFARGDDQQHFKFEGHFEKRAADDYLTWSGWSGPWRFATDGKEIVKEPQQQQPGPSMEIEFRRRYPDAKGIVRGLAYPTADELGYGIYSPGLGWGGKDEPEIHKVMALLDRELGKPTHLMDHTQDINPKHYRISVSTSR